MSRKFKFYELITDLNTIPGLGKLTGTTLAVCTKKEEMVEYLNKFIRLLHRDDFRNWCEKNNRKEDDKNSWKDFMDNNIFQNDLDHLGVVETTYTPEEIAAMLRCDFNYIPLGCSFEHKYEFDLFEKRLESSDISTKSDEYLVWQEVKKARNLKELEGWQ